MQYQSFYWSVYIIYYYILFIIIYYIYILYKVYINDNCQQICDKRRIQVSVQSVGVFSGLIGVFSGLHVHAAMNSPVSLAF